MRQPPAAAGGTVREAPGDTYGCATSNGHLPRHLRRASAAGVTGDPAARPAPGGASAPDGKRAAGQNPAAPGENRPSTEGAVPALARGVWRQAAGALEFAKHQLAGGGEADQFGFDPEFNTTVLLPFARLFYRHWFRVQVRGLDNVPAEGPALIVANHSGTLPLDAVMLQTGVHDDHPAHRNLRLLGADLLYQVPLLTTIARKGGHTRARPVNAHVLLRAGELVGVFPEGFKGIGKPFAERYQLRRFGRGGFAVTAIRAGVPIIPCAIVGAEEIYPMIGNAAGLARLLRLPYFPITPMFPWLGALGAVPLPSRWIIEFCPPVATSGYQRGAEADPAVVTDLSGRVRGTVQRKLDDLLAERGPAFG